MFIDFKKMKFSQSILWIFIFFFVFIALFGFYYFNTKILIVRYSFFFFFLFVSFLLFFKTSIGIICHTYYNEAKIEFKKIVWPSRREVVTFTLIIFLVIFLSCIFLGFVDFLLTKIVFKIIN
ncbi:MAG TPA: preprotein translocase subunit SecE [Candidatus Azosocius sp. HAIN]